MRGRIRKPVFRWCKRCLEERGKYVKFQPYGRASVLCPACIESSKQNRIRLLKEIKRQKDAFINYLRKEEGEEYVNKHRFTHISFSLEDLKLLEMKRYNKYLEEVRGKI